ncbi:MAG: sigma 54-interacting transcriptional regulator [Acidobacteriia bacterium]|nr:sigma 54-interacting transcriptional regulator [Terriglobia bacterium]
MNAVETSGDLEHIVFEIAKGAWSDTGEGFFRSLVHQLSRALQADLVLVGARLPGRDRIGALAVHAPDREIALFEYDLAGTPCAGVIQKQQLCTYAEGVHRLFPTDAQLVKMRAEGYVGSPLVDSSGRCLGLILAVTRRPLANPKLAEAVLQIFGARAAAELERKQYEEALARTEQRWHGFVTHGNEAMIRVALEQPISLDASEDEKIEHCYHYGFVADCNDQAAALFGLAGAPELIGARLELVSPRADSEQMERLLAFIRAGCRFSQVERTLAGRTILMTRDGIVADGKLWGAWVTGRDISALKEAEAQVRTLNRELEQRVQELSELRARLEQDNAYLQEEIRAEHPIDEMVGSSPRFVELVSRIQLVASTSATVLICGETGTGKELVVRAIHNLSERRQRPLVKINCAAISAGLVESELFGHVKGAFTGATERRIGRFEYANGGTLFLDEVTELPLETQAKLLRVLQEQEFEPVGSNRTVQVDVRLLAATNRDLAEVVREGRFRMDLYYRLLVVPVEVPPLRDRREDIPALAAHFIARHNRQFGRRFEGISTSMMQQLLAHHWPGNIRELENVLARAMVLCQGAVLDEPLFASAAGPSEAPPRTLQEAERRHIENALASTRWVLEGSQGAAAILGLNASTLRSRMKRLGIQRPA